MPYGENFFEKRSHWATRYKFNAKEKDEETGLYYYGARYYTPDLGLWLSVDPLSDERPNLSPYNYCQNNPVILTDPTGALDAPIYDPDGNLMGTDDEGLQGKAIVMDKDKFSQGMKHEDALKNSKGYEGLKDDAAKKNFATSYSSLPSRHDYDGKLTLDEANSWYNKGGGKPLFVDASKIDLSPVKKSDFSKIGDSFYKNFAFTTNTETGLIYGNIKLTLMNDKGVIKLGGAGKLLDKYNFDYKGGVTNIPRNIATWIGKQKAGKGTSYNIFNYGTGTVK